MATHIAAARLWIINAEPKISAYVKGRGPAVDNTIVQKALRKETVLSLASFFEENVFWFT